MAKQYMLSTTTTNDQYTNHSNVIQTVLTRSNAWYSLEGKHPTARSFIQSLTGIRDNASGAIQTAFKQEYSGFMPAIAEKHDANGGQVFRYAHTTKQRVAPPEGWFFRLYDAATRRYRIGKVDGAESREEAIANAYKVLLSFNETSQPAIKKQSNPRLKQRTISDELNAFIKWERERVDAGLKDAHTVYKRKNNLNKLAGYLESKDIAHVSKIKKTTFEDYPIYRMGMMKSTINVELKDFGVFFRQYLLPRDLISGEIVNDRNFLKRVQIDEDELDANPAITPKDYVLINSRLQETGAYYKSAVNHKGLYTRNMMWAFIHLLKNSGCRPSEMLRIRRKDIDLTNDPRWSESLNEWRPRLKLKLHIRKSKTGKKRDVLVRSNGGERMAAWIAYQNQYMYEHTRHTITNESLIFGKPDDALEKTFTYTHFSRQWRNILNPIRKDLEGNPFSDRKYTLYSLRSTFIEDCITDGLDVYLVARLCGNSVQIIQKFYDRHNVLARAEEIQHIDYGKPKPPVVEQIDLSTLGGEVVPPSGAITP